MTKVAFSMIFYPVAMGRYLLDALLRRPDVEVWTAGPYSGRWIPWQGGMELPGSYVLEPDLVLPLGSMPTINYAVVEAAPKPWKPDLWIEANAAMGTIGRPSCKYVVVGTDPHVCAYDHERENADIFFCMQRPYMKAGDRWLPYAYDPLWHAQTTVPFREREYDAALLGLAYAHRITLVNALRARGRKVRFEIGPAYGDARAIYHRTRVGLNWSSMQDTNARAYELMAMGLPPVMNRTPDLVEMFKDGEHFLGFTNLNEAVQNVEALLADPDLAERMGRAAHEAVRPHTWDARVGTILTEAGFGGGIPNPGTEPARPVPQPPG